MITCRNISPIKAISAAFAVLALTAAAVPASAQSAVFNFGTDILGTGTVMTDTNNGLSATFSSPFDPSIFTVQSSAFSNIPGNMLGPGPFGATFQPLEIDFSSPLSSFSLDFGLDGFLTSSLTLTGFSGGPNGKEVGSASATGSIPGGNYLFPQGSLSFANAAAFDTVVVTSTAQNFGIGNLQVLSPAAVPEASTTISLGLLLILGLGAVAVSACRKRCSVSAL